jgi:ATP phosphoribosyltransferase
MKVSGAAEAYTCCGGIDAVVDLVESGDTLAGNGLVVREVLLENSFCLVANRAVASRIGPYEVCASIAGTLTRQLT